MATYAGGNTYPICATPRSGSTLLCGLLRYTGVAGRPEWYFRVPGEQSWADRWQIARDAGGSFDYRHYVEAAIADGSTDNGVFGARVMWGTMDEMVAKLGAVHPDIAGADPRPADQGLRPSAFRPPLARRDRGAGGVVGTRRADELLAPTATPPRESLTSTSSRSIASYG